MVTSKQKEQLQQLRNELGTLKKSTAGDFYKRVCNLITTISNVDPISRKAKRNVGNILAELESYKTKSRKIRDKNNSKKKKFTSKF